MRTDVRKAKVVEISTILELSINRHSNRCSYDNHTKKIIREISNILEISCILKPVETSPLPTAKETKNMATKTKAPKSVKITTSSAITSTIETSYSNLINHDGEVAFILQVADFMAEGKATVRGVQDAIASCKGTAPTIRKSHVQHFPILAGIIREVKGAKAKTIADLLKLAERVGREHGAEGARNIIAEVEDVAELEEKSPTQTNSKKGKGAKSSVTAPLTLELAIAASLQGIRQVAGKSLKDAKTADLDNLRALLGVLVQIEKNSRPVAKANA